MKKILTLAIALVMVFAIAAPALAAGWDNPVTPDEFENLELDVTPLAVDKSSMTWNGTGYQKLDKTYPVVAGTLVHAYAEITIPKADDLSADVMSRIERGQGKITISVSNLTDVKLNVRNKDGLVIENDKVVNGAKSYPINGYDFGTTITVEVWGNAAKSEKDAKITATLGVYNKFEANESQFRFYAKDGKEYVIVADGRTYTVTPNNDTDTGMIFQTNGDDQLEAAWVLLDATAADGEQYLVVDSFGEVRFLKISDNTTATGKELEEVKAMMDRICNAMGFSYSGRAYMNKTLIEKNLGVVVEGSASLTYPTGYVQELVTDDPSVKPPQTGDNASVVGFVMIAIALVAAAAVTVKKVRA